jgi:hypothetical protein
MNEAMKNTIISMSLLMLGCTSAYAQWTNGLDINNTINGTVGIGTNTPQSKLEVSGGKITVSFKNTEHTDGNTIPMIGSTFPGLVDFGAGVNTLIENAGSNRYGLQFITREQYAINPSPKMTIFGNGNVGIGTIAPQSKLEVSGGKITVSFKNSEHTDGNTIPMIGSTFPGLTDFGVGVNTLIESAGANRYGLQFITREQYNIAASPKMTIQGNGNVGIGTTTPGTFKLAVNGKIWSQEVNVAMTNPGPDYVFEKDYDLLSLTELETYINQNKHLPEVPSAKEMEKDGLNLKEMNLILLKKVEELTLHLIEQQKHIYKVSNENAELKKIVTGIINQQK